MSCISISYEFSIDNFNNSNNNFPNFVFAHKTTCKFTEGLKYLAFLLADELKLPYYLLVLNVCKCGPFAGTNVLNSFSNTMLKVDRSDFHWCFSSIISYCVTTIFSMTLALSFIRDNLNENTLNLYRKSSKLVRKYLIQDEIN